MINWPKNPNIGDIHTHTNGAKWNGMVRVGYL